MLYPFKFIPIIIEKVWGGKKLSSILNKELDTKRFFIDDKRTVREHIFYHLIIPFFEFDIISWINRNFANIEAYNRS